MTKSKKNLNKYFELKDLTQSKIYSKEVVKSLVRSVLEPIVSLSSKAIVFTRIKEAEGIDSLIKRLEYSKDVTLKEFSSREFSKFNAEDTDFIILNSQRYNCAFLFKEIGENKYNIYLKLNSKLVFDVYETLKSAFLIDYDEEFYQYRPERRENDLMNKAVLNILDQFEETIREKECNLKIRENYRNVNETNATIRNEMMKNVKAVAHEIKNQLSILDIYTRIFEKKTQDFETTKPMRKSIELIKAQIEQFKNLDAVNLAETDIKPIIQEAVKMYSSILKEKNNKLILIDEMAGLEARVFVDKEKFLIVVNNIIKNAHDSTQNDEITIKMSHLEGKIKISFINHGEMIKQENREKIFDTGYTTKKDGWGVGLSVCKKFIGSQFGALSLDKSDKEETIFSITLPLSQA